jgi:hypothetical protein
MNWRDERIGLQIERALAGVRLARGCELEILVRDGKVLLTARFVRLTEFDAVIDALAAVPGIRDIDFEVSIVEALVIRSWRDGEGGDSRGELNSTN